MVGAGNDKLAVTSWGWVDEDGKFAETPATTVFRLWRVRRNGELVGLLATESPDVMDALRIAYEGWGTDSEELMSVGVCPTCGGQGAFGEKCGPCGVEYAFDD